MYNCNWPHLVGFAHFVCMCGGEVSNCLGSFLNKYPTASKPPCNYGACIESSHTTMCNTEPIHNINSLDFIEDEPRLCRMFLQPVEALLGSCQLEPNLRVPGRRQRFAHLDGLRAPQRPMDGKWGRVQTAALPPRRWLQRSWKLSKQNKQKLWACSGNMQKQVPGTSFIGIISTGGCFPLTMAQRLSLIYVARRMWQPCKAIRSGWKAITRPWSWRLLPGVGTLKNHAELSHQKQVWLGPIGMYAWRRCAEASIWWKKKRS